MQVYIYTSVCVYVKKLGLLHFWGQWFSCHQGSAEMNSFVLIILSVTSIFVEAQDIIIVPLSDMQTNSVAALSLWLAPVLIVCH